MLHGLCSPLIDKSASPTWFGTLDLGGLQGADAGGGSRRELLKLERPQQNVDLSWPDTKPCSQNIQQFVRSERCIQTYITVSEIFQASDIASGAPSLSQCTS